MNSKLKKLASIMLAGAMALTSIPASAFAADAQATTTLKTVKEKYVDANDGKEIANKTSYTESAQTITPKEIENYTFVDYETEMEYVYSHKDLTYIIGRKKTTLPGQPSYAELDGNLTRAEAAQIFYRLYAGVYPETVKRMSENTFKDVKTTSWYYDAVEMLYNLGIVTGTTKDTFSPNDMITRAELAVIAARFNELDYQGGNKFSDVAQGHWAYSYINAAADKGWVKGYPNGTFKPDQNITRGETMSLVNGMINRSVTKAQIKEIFERLGLSNPYPDTSESHWAYPDCMEATIKHSDAEWHGHNYNDGKVNVIIEKYVDVNGKEIATKVQSEGKAIASPKDIPAYSYMGYIKTITYTYTDGAVIPSIEKKADKKTSAANDEITYTITMSNGEKATSDWENVVFKDEIPNLLKLVDGSVYLNGQSVAYTLENGTLSAEVGKIKPNKSSVLTFKAIVQEGAYNETIYNTAVAEGSNGAAKDDDSNKVKVEDTDDGVIITDGRTRPMVEKTSNKAGKTVSVGDKVTYTVTYSNYELATMALNDIMFEDVLDEGLTFDYGSVTVNGENHSFVYDEDTRLLSVSLVNSLAPDENVVIKFVVTVNEKAYGRTIENLATVKSSNGDTVQDKDDGITIADGKVKLDVTKAASKEEAKVGDTLNYTSEVTNHIGSETNAKNVVWKDVLDEGLTFAGNVQVDGYSAAYSFDNDSRMLTIKLGDMAKDQTKTVSFDATINSTAYGTTIYNTAVAEGDNAPEAEGTDDGVVVEEGNPNGHIGAKTVSKSTAKVGDTLTYTIPLENSALATADWTGMVVTDVIPEYLTYAGNVKLNGVATTLYSFDAATKTLTLMPEAIKAGEKAVFSFDVIVDEGAQGMYIVNTAILDDNGDKTQLPDTGVQIEDGETKPIVNKKASVTEARVGDVFEYTVTVTNGAKATVDWRDIVLTDVVPTGLQFMGNVYINNEVALFTKSGQALSVLIGDLKPNETATITFEVQVLESAAGQTLVNTAVAEGSNGKGTGTDNGVSVPDQSENNENGFYVTKDVDKTIVDVSSSATADEKKVDYTVVIGNNSGETWKNVKFTDTFDLTMITPSIYDSIKVNGVVIPKSKFTFSGSTLTIPLGDIAQGEMITITFPAEFKVDAAGQTYINYATATGDNGYATDSAPEVQIVGDKMEGGDKPVQPSDIHYQLFNGYVNGDWRPNDKVSLQEACAVLYRLISNGGSTWLPRGTVTVPTYYWPNGDEYKPSEAVAYFVSWGVISPNSFQLKNMTEGVDYVVDYTFTPNGYLRVWPTAGQLNAMTSKVTGASNAFSGSTTRIAFARTVCQLTDRDLNPNTNGLSGISTFPDVSGSNVGIVTEVANGHDYVRDATGGEVWTRVFTQF